ncbi:hypothetical protein ACFX15_045929 [Malus domestica]
MGIKLDMNKAYDRVEWDFLETVMEHLGFQRRWIAMVMQCVKTVEFSILINGRPGRAFKPSRGLRQGDPLSPYLFLIISEVLSLLISKAVQQGFLEGLKISASGPVLSHLLFADDTLIFLMATKQNCRNLSSLLQVFCRASGQQVSLQKSVIYFGLNTPT